jgi:membrane-associated phospholipid phosphatase
MDVLVGAAIGTICSLLFYALLKDKLFGNWGNQSLFKKSI